MAFGAIRRRRKWRTPGLIFSKLREECLCRVHRNSVCHGHLKGIQPILREAHHFYSLSCKYIRAYPRPVGVYS